MKDLKQLLQQAKESEHIGPFQNNFLLPSTTVKICSSMEKGQGDGIRLLLVSVRFLLDTGTSSKTGGQMGQITDSRMLHTPTLQDAKGNQAQTHLCLFWTANAFHIS